MKKFYVQVSVAGKTKSDAKGGKGKAMHSSKRKYYLRMVGKETSRTGMKRVKGAPMGNFAGVISMDMLPKFDARSSASAALHKKWKNDAKFEMTPTYLKGETV